MSDDTVVLGKISGVFGVRGQIKVYSYTDPRENILDYDPWLLASGHQSQPYHLVEGQVHGKGIIARLEGCDDRDQAMALMGSQIRVRRDQLPETAEGEYYWSDLTGLTVKTEEGLELGRVSYLFETGSNDVLVVKGDRERLIPFIRHEVVKTIDLQAKVMVVDWDAAF